MAPPAADRWQGRVAAQPAVRLWVCRSDRVSAEAERYVRLLPPDVLARARRRRAPEALVAAAFLRAVLAAETGEAPERLQITTRCRWCGDPRHGKPALAPVAGATALCFSLAHTRGLALLAVSAVEVGVDVERGGGPGVTDGSELVLNDGERASLPQDRAGLEQAYLGLWTRKESYLKGLGLGLVRDPRRVTFEPGASPWSVVLDDGTPTTWRSRALALDDPWVGALAIEAPQARVQRESWPVP
jgi:4'-phosphopantetheinyl transferase